VSSSAGEQEHINDNNNTREIKRGFIFVGFYEVGDALFSVRVLNKKQQQVLSINNKPVVVFENWGVC